MTKIIHSDRGSYAEVSTEGDYIAAICEACYAIGADQDDVAAANIAEQVSEEQVAAGLRAEAGRSGSSVIMVQSFSESTTNGSIGWNLVVTDGRAAWLVYAKGTGYQNSKGVPVASLEQRDYLMSILRVAAGSGTR